MSSFTDAQAQGHVNLPRQWTRWAVEAESQSEATTMTGTGHREEEESVNGTGIAETGPGIKEGQNDENLNYSIDWMERESERIEGGENVHIFRS